MTRKLQLSRRHFLICTSSSVVFHTSGVYGADGLLNIHVVKNPQCGCCDAWIEILLEKGFSVTMENRPSDLLTKFKIESGIPNNMIACHTAKIDGYFIEGHVPPSDIKRLIAERPNALGLAVPGMPYGSPGMGPEEKRESYSVYIIKTDKTSEVFKHYPKAGLMV